MSSAGPLIAQFRRFRRLSQLELSQLADISPRHLSFLESGRSRASREMVLKLADAMELPLRDSNLLLSAAGFATLYSEASLDSPALQPVKQALETMLSNHDPYPAAVLDGSWNVLMANRAQRRLLDLLSPAGANEKTNVLELVFRPDGLRPCIVNWDELASLLLRRLQKQVIAYSRPETRQLLCRLLAMEPPSNWQQPPASVEGPMLSVHLRIGDTELRLFSTLTQFGTALDVGLEELTIESYFPEDEATKRLFDVLVD